VFGQSFAQPGQLLLLFLLPLMKQMQATIEPTDDAAGNRPGKVEHHSTHDDTDDCE
jgi:hypothetical protein